MLFRFNLFCYLKICPIFKKRNKRISTNSTGYSLFDKNVSKDKNDHLTILSFMKEINYPKSPSKWNCTFCPYGEDKELCGAKAHFE